MRVELAFGSWNESVVRRINANKVKVARAKDGPGAGQVGCGFAGGAQIPAATGPAPS